MKKILATAAAFIIIAGAGIGISMLLARDVRLPDGLSTQTVHGAVGGGKENLLKDETFNKILRDNYGLVQENVDWSNNRLIRDNLVYQDAKGAEHPVDFVFFSDERFYEYYKKPAAADEAPRQPILKAGIVLSTPIVIYSWDAVCDALIQHGVVTEREGIYYITDMPKLIGYIESRTTWADIGLPDIYGSVNITSPNPVSSSPGTTYYGLLASIMHQGFVDENNIAEVLPPLKSFYALSGFMNNTPSDIFDLYLRTGMGAKPLVVDYEKSIIDFAYHNAEGYNQVKDRIRILYPQPTIWNSHCLIAFTEAGSAYVDAFSDTVIQETAWQRYGFRTGTAGSLDMEGIVADGIAREVTSVVAGLRKELYDAIIAYLSDND